MSFSWVDFELARKRVDARTFEVLVNAYRKTLWLSGSTLMRRFK